MIKKIYDRDTGNIYDVGADNKLKLVAEGTLEWDDEHRVYRNVYCFEVDKNYLFKMFTDDGEYSFFATILLCTDDLKCSIPQKELMESGDHIIIDQSYEDNITIYSMKSGDNFDFYGGYKYKIYELPFSM